MQKFLENWMLPLAISIGAAAYLVLYNVPYLAENVEPGVSAFAKNVQPVLIAVMLFLQFNRISPHKMAFRAVVFSDAYFHCADRSGYRSS